MNIITTIKKIFGRTQPAVTKSTIPYDSEAYLIKHAKEIEEETKLFIDKYGNDFNLFFYRQNLDTFIRGEILQFRDPESKYNNSFLGNTYWTKKHPFNFPGPFYTGESDTCGTGDIEAPNNVMYDKNTMEFIFRQPKSFEDLLGVIDAAAVEVLDSYSCNGNNFWTYTSCKDWWKDRFDIITEITKTEEKRVKGDKIDLYVNYLKSDAEKDLRKYCYFLDNGSYPKVEITTLPQLE